MRTCRARFCGGRLGHGDGADTDGVEVVLDGAEVGHPRAVELVGELAVRSDEFAALWALHDVEEPTRGQMRLPHPQVGELTLDWDAYPIPGNPGPALMVGTAAEDSPDAERLQLLAGRLGGS